MKYARLIGTGSYLPEKVLTNADLERLVDTTDDWIVSRTGIRKRHIAGPKETTCDLAEQAARRAIAAAGIDAESIDLIIMGTTTPDQVFPSTACLLQQRLGCRGGAAFDVQAVCSGFIYALDIADKFIRTGAAKRALVVGAETLSRILDWSDRSTCVLFGDGAGAVILEAGEQPGIMSSHINADGRYHDMLDATAGDEPGSRPVIRMRGNEVFKMAVTTLGRMVDEVLAVNHLQQGDIDWLVPHQANLRIIEATAKKLSLPRERVVVTVGEHGNTSAASVPLALDQAIRDGRIKPGETILLEAFGGGFTWGATLIKY